MSHDTGHSAQKNDFKETVQIRYMLLEKVENKQVVVQAVEKETFEPK